MHGDGDAFPPVGYSDIQYLLRGLRIALEPGEEPTYIASYFFRGLEELRATWPVTS